MSVYAQNPHYRAWGALQNLTYGNGTQMSLGFNNRLQVTNYTLAGAGATAGYNLMQKQYQYYADGALRFAQDQLDTKFDRFNRYDQLGRIIEGKSGAEARGQTVAQNDQSTQLPYSQSYAYDAFNNLTQRNNKHWGVDYWYGQSNNLSYTYQNNRVQGATYDADGRMTVTAPVDGYSESTYDAAGQLIRLFDSTSSDIYRSYDGNGREVKRRKLRWEDNPYAGTSPFGSWVDEGNTFFIRSSILGNETISEVDAQGKKIKSYVKANGATLATQSIVGTTQSVDFEHYDASGMSYRTTGGGGISVSYAGTIYSPGELDPLGNNMGIETPYVEPLQVQEPPPDKFNNQQPFLLDMEEPLMVNGQRITCTIDGMEVPGGCRQGLRGLGNSTDIDFANSDRLALSALGISARWVPGGADTGTPDTPGQPGEDPVRTTKGDPGRWEYYGVGSWDGRMQQAPESTQQINPFERFNSKTKLSDKECDEHLSKIFGGFAKAMEKAGDINGFNRLSAGVGHSATAGNAPYIRDLKTGKMKRNPDNGGIIHTYTDEKGSARTDVPLYAPGGWMGQPTSYFEGRNSALVFTYSNGITIEFVHTGTFNTNKKPSIPNNPGAGELAEIGFVAGYGGGFAGKGRESTAMVWGGSLLITHI